MTETEVQPVANAEGASAQEPSAPSTVVELANGHHVRLRARPSIPMGIAALEAIKSGPGGPASIGALAEVYLHFGIEWWDFADAQGNPEPINDLAIERLLPFDEGGLEVAERADALYSETVMRPLLMRLGRLSKPSPTDVSTPPTLPSGSPLPTLSGRSSRNGTAGKL